MEQSQILNSVIKKNKTMSISSLKKELRINKNMSLIRVLMEYFVKSVESIDYSVNSNEYYALLRVLNYVCPQDEAEFKLIEEYVKKINKVTNEKKIKCSVDKNLLDLLDTLDERLGSFLIETRFKMVEKKDKIIQHFSIDENNLRMILNDYIFRYKDYGHLNLLMSLCPNACNIKFNGKTLIIRIIKSFFTNFNDRDFLSKVITLFISNPNFQISEEEKKEIANLCEKYNLFMKLKDLIFIKEVLTTLEISNEFDIKEKMNLLKMRFGIQDTLFDNIRISHESFPVDMTDRVALTIDRARDNAFSIEKKADGTFELDLYTTDVTAIKKGSPLDVYAYRHFSTIYTKDAWITMIPEPIVLSFSLNKGLRRVIAYKFKFTSKLQLIDCEIVPAMIKVRDNLSYSDSAEIIKGESELSSIIGSALDLSEAMVDSLGTMDRYHRLKEVVRELGGSINDIPDKYLDTPGNRIIATFAVFLNHYLATMFDKSRLPFIYRVNDFDNSTNIKMQLEKYRCDKATCEMLRSIQTLYKSSSFSAVNTGHKGLGLNAYTQATSPGRLYPSLMIQRMIVDLFVERIKTEEYIEKYQDVDVYAEAFTALQERNNRFMVECNKLCRKLTLDNNR